MNTNRKVISNIINRIKDRSVYIDCPNTSVIFSLPLIPLLVWILPFINNSLPRDWMTGIKTDRQTETLLGCYCDHVTNCNWR